MNTHGQASAGCQRELNPASPVNLGSERPVHSNPAAAASVIGVDILVTGDIEAEVDLHIEGRVLGNVRCATLILGERSSVKGKVLAQRVRVSGVIDGAVETIDLAVEATARVKGEISFSRLRVANGGVIEGTITHKPLPRGAAEESRLKLVEQPAPKVKEHYFE